MDVWLLCGVMMKAVVSQPLVFEMGSEEAADLDPTSPTDDGGRAIGEKDRAAAWSCG